MKVNKSKPWRVSHAGAVVYFRSQKAAYEHVKSLLGLGQWIRVRHWDEGRWALYEEFPAEEAMDA